MKKRFFAITLIVIGAFIACKKVGENITDKKYSDVELNIDKNSSFKEEERKIKEGIMKFPALTTSDRKLIVNGIVMDNRNVAHITGNVKIFEMLSLANKIQFIKTIAPNTNFVIFNNLTKQVEYEYISNNILREKNCLMAIYPAKTGGYGSDCGACGESMCMLYYSCLTGITPMTDTK